MRSFLHFLLMACMFAAMVASTALAEDQASSGRRVRQNITPEYPAIARKLSIHGTVQLTVKVGADGAVREVAVNGGNPVLVDASLKAVRRWRYEATGRESVELVKFVF